MFLESYRRPKHHARLALVILTLNMLAMLGCQPTNTAQQRPVEPPVSDPILQPQGHGTVQVEIDAQCDLGLSLFQIRGNESCRIQDLSAGNRTNGQSLQTVELESGLFVVRAKESKFAVPVPAIAMDPSSKLSISIEQPPAPIEGWCWIPPGPALVGDTLGVGREDERPAKIVEVDGFWMAEKEVTNQQYADFLSEQDEIPIGWIDLESRKCLIRSDAEAGSYSADTSTFENAAEMPVVMVSLKGALAYCEWLSQKLGHEVRLPHEFEWEKAARGPESFVYSYGNIYKQSLANQESGKLKPVASYPPNSFGLYDMTGNVFEWMIDRADPTKSQTTLNHSLRGGSFVLDGMYLRNSFRMKQSPTVMTDDIGFRVMCPALHKDN